MSSATDAVYHTSVAATLTALPRSHSSNACTMLPLQPGSRPRRRTPWLCSYCACFLFSSLHGCAGIVTCAAARF